MRFLRALFPRLPASRRQVAELKFLILNLQEITMANKEILAAKLAEIGDAVGKIGTETGALVTQVADLKSQLENAGVDQALIDQADAVLASVKRVDDMVPDAPVVEPEPQPENPPAEGEQPV